jgi:hypothetical protein
MAAKPQPGFLRLRAKRARPAGPAQSSVFHYLARRGPTKEAHRRALNQPDGLLHSVAGQGHGRFLPVTLPRYASDQRKQSEAGNSRSPTPGGTHQGRGWGTHQGRDQGTPTGTDQGRPRGPEKSLEGRPWRAAGIAACNSPTGTVWGPKSALARPGPCTRPRSADALTRREYHPARQTPTSRSFLLAAGADGPGWSGGVWRLRGLHLDPGSGRMVRRHGSGGPPSAQQHPPGEALPRPAGVPRAAQAPALPAWSPPPPPPP